MMQFDDPDDLDAARATRETERLLASWSVPSPPPGLRARILAEVESAPAPSARADSREHARTWTVPSPPPELNERILARVAADARTATRHRRARLAPYAVAAAALLAAATWFGGRGGDPQPDRARGSAPLLQPIPVDDLVRRYAVRVQAARNRQFPGGVGTFDTQPVIADRNVHPSGNAFHRSLRRVLDEDPGVEDGR